MEEMMNQVSVELPEEKKEVSKPFSLRLGEESMHTFRLWCDEQGLNQADGFAYMVKQLELQQAKELIPNRQKEVENFQSLLTALTEAFMHSLELNENAEMRIRQTLQTQLDSKEQAILDYQETSKKQNEKVKELKEKADLVDVLQKEIEELKKNIWQRDNQLKDKDEINLILSEKLAKTKSMEDEVVALKQVLEEKNSEMIELEKQKIKDAQEIKDAWAEKIQAEKDVWQAEKDKLKDKLQADLRAAIAEEQNKARENEEKLRDKIADLEKETGRQEKELELLRADNGKKEQTIERITNSYNDLQKEFTEFKKLHSAEK